MDATGASGTGLIGPTGTGPMAVSPNPYSLQNAQSQAFTPPPPVAAAQRFDFDATVIRKLEEAGAVLCAKLAMVELAGGMGYRQPHASFTGPGINPWHPDAWSGGSSSGSGSAVSAGLVPFAIGSETWGSILSPAGYCGITGLRPSYGRVVPYRSTKWQRRSTASASG